MGNLYCGISLDLNYTKQTLDILMPGYIKMQLLKYKRAVRHVQYCLYSSELRKYGTNAQSTLPMDDLQKLTKNKIKKKIQKNV
jgi:hypothetical protein